MRNKIILLFRLIFVFSGYAIFLFRGASGLTPLGIALIVVGMLVMRGGEKSNPSMMTKVMTNLANAIALSICLFSVLDVSRLSELFFMPVTLTLLCVFSVLYLFLQYKDGQNSQDRHSLRNHRVPFSF